MKKDTINILFSGGLDSTYMLHKALKENYKYIQLHYLTIENNHNKVQYEIKQAEQIVQKFKDLHPYVLISFHTRARFSLPANGNVHFPQIPVWITGLLYSIDNNADVWIGYCMGDQAISHLEDIKKVWRSYSSLQESKSKLVFPLSKIPKEVMMRELPNNIFQLTYFCENPSESENENTFVDCGSCASCKRAIYEGTFYVYNRNSHLAEIRSEPFTEHYTELSQNTVEMFPRKEKTKTHTDWLSHLSNKPIELNRPTSLKEVHSVQKHINNVSFFY